MMKTEFLKITGNAENDSAIIVKAAEVIKNGGLVAIPTETVYGLAGSALISSSAEKIYAAKGRPSDNPLIVHIAEPSDAEKYAYPNSLYYRLAERFMPGPLTVILKKKENIPDTVTAGGDTVAVRCPAHPVAHKLIEVSGHPIAAPSANRSGVPSPTKAEHVLEDMDGRIDMIIDGGECSIGLESTVIRLDGDNECTILRPGHVTADMLAEICHQVRISPAVIEPALAASEKPESPGMKYKHYAPNAELILIDADEDAFFEYVCENSDENCGVFVADEDIHRIKLAHPLPTGAKGDAAEISRRFFTLLRNADEVQLKTVYAQLPPAEGEYLALYNRIVRAAGCRILKLGKK